jgi:hypothetical protein
MHLRGRMEPRHAGGGAQNIGHQRAATGAKLGQREGRGRALVKPALRKAQAQQFAEHLADLGRGGEIAARTKRVAGGVIAVLGVHQAIGHIVGQRYRAGLRDAPRQKIGQRRHALRARAMNQTPAKIIGMVRICPMVSP